MKKNDFKMLESIGSILSKDELRVIIGGGENLQVGEKEPPKAKRVWPCTGKREGDACFDSEPVIIGVCKPSPYNHELECRPKRVV